MGQHAHLLGLAHVGAALAAIVAGGLVTLTRKGSDVHRRLGLLYVASMVAVNVTALSIYELFGGFGPFHAMAIFSLATVIVGWVAVRRRGPYWLPRHAWWMAGSYVGLLAAAASEITTRYLEWKVGFAGGVVLASVPVGAAGLWIMGRRIPPLVGRIGPRRGWLESGSSDAR